MNDVGLRCHPHITEAILSSPPQAVKLPTGLLTNSLSCFCSKQARLAPSSAVVLVM
jgi:hypothetical protein